VPIYVCTAIGASTITDEIMPVISDDNQVDNGHTNGHKKNTRPLDGWVKLEV